MRRRACRHKGPRRATVKRPEEGSAREKRLMGAQGGSYAGTRARSGRGGGQKRQRKRDAGNMRAPLGRSPRRAPRKLAWVGKKDNKKPAKATTCLVAPQPSPSPPFSMEVGN